MLYEDDIQTTEQSGPFEYLSTGLLKSTHPHHPDAWIGYKQFDDYNIPELGDLKSKWRMENVYNDENYINEKPLFTTKTDDFSGWIDHIWINKKINIDMVLSVPIKQSDTTEKINNFQPIPNLHHPSDHIPIGFVASIKKNIL